MKRVRVEIKGGVQGVFFRKFVKDNADKLNLKIVCMVDLIIRPLNLV